MSSVATIFEKSIKEIEAGNWICGDLCYPQYDDAKGDLNPKKHMACAVGMVSLYGGHTKDSTITLKNGNVVDIKTAMYPEDESVKKAAPRIRTTLEYLVRAIPNKDFEPLEDHDYNSDGVYELLNTYTKQNLSQWPMAFLSGAVVSYNDGAIQAKRVSSKSAAAWFKRAYKLYQKDQAKAALNSVLTKTVKPMHTNMNLTESKTLSFA